MGDNVFRTLSERYPFMTLCSYAGVEYLGVIQNQDDSVTTIYDYTGIVGDELKRKFLDLAAVWWWESNRSIPINIFLKQDWDVFRPYLRTFTNKDLEIVHGPCTSLTDIARKKSKRKSITLVRRIE